jgi:uncharacterized repeat protein (TIGR01451 family)
MTLPNGVAPSDWSGIQKEYQRHRHGAFPIDGGGYRARNWEQQWVTRFDGRGFEVIPDEGGWRWGLQLQSYGFRGAERDVAGQAHVSTNVERIGYQWDARVEEWFINSARGLEHGFTITERPPGAGPLLLHLAVRGNLQGEGSGRGVRFVDRAGTAAVNYTGLRALDSGGRELTARMTTEAGGLRIEVDERGASYPITIDPLVQQAYIKASNSRMFLGFGASVAIDGDTVVVGTDNESSKATGVNGDQSDTSAAQAGAAYVFVRVGTTWSQQAYLKPINTQEGERFGHSVGISGDSIVVGAFWDGQLKQGVNPDPTLVLPNGAPFSGAAYTYIRVGTNWFPEAYIKASNTKKTLGFGDNFGNSVAISGDIMAVGAPYESSNAVGIDGDQKNTQGYGGAVYLFGRTAGVWVQQAYVKGPVLKGQEFGWSVAASGSTVVVGAPYENSGSSGTAGDEANTSAPQSGAAYVYASSGGVWGLQAYLKASNTDAQDQFGTAVSVSGDTVAVGAIWEDSNATGINGDQTDNSLSNSGAAYVFVRSGSLWSQQAYIKASDPTANSQFGAPLGLDGDTLVVGSPYHYSGEGYVFTRSGTAWSQLALLFPSNGASFFSTSVGVSGTTIVAGGFDRSNATGVNGDQLDTSAPNSGAVYVSLLPTPPPPVTPPDLQLTLQHFDSFTAGSPGKYRIVAFNTLAQISGSIGPTTSKITVTDPLVPGITLQPASIVAAQWDCSTSTTLLLQCTTDQILAPQATSTNIDFTVDVTGAGGYLITNVATIGGGGETSAQLSNDTWPDLAIVAGVPAPDLTIVSTHTANFTQGGTGSFFLTVTNSGPAAWGNYVGVSDSLPTGLSATAIGGTGWTCSLSGISGLGMGCTRQDALAAGASYPVITIAVNVAANAPASVSNAGLMLTNSLENQANDAFLDPVTIIVPLPFDLSVTLTHSGNFAPGGTVMFTARVTNVGAGPFPPSPGFNLIASSILAPLTGLSGLGWTCSPAGQPPYCTRSDGLAAGASFPDVTFTMQIPANASGGFGLGVEVTSYPNDPNAGNNTANDSAPIIQPLPPDMTATVTHSGNFVPGGTVTFTVSVRNVGAGPLPPSAPPNLGYDFIVFPAGPLISMNGAGWDCHLAPNPPTCYRPDGLAAGGSFPDVTLTILIPANATGSFVLGVWVLHLPTDSNPNNDEVSDGATITLPLPPDMSVSLTHSGAFAAGGTVTVTGRVTNVGGGPLPPGGFSYLGSFGFGSVVAISAPGWTCTPSNSTFNCYRLDGLAAGASFSDIAATILLPANATGTFLNSALIAHVANDPNSNNDRASDDVPLVLLPKQNPTILWGNPADIVLGTALNGVQLNANSTVAGTYVYSPPSGTVLPYGSGQVLSVAFTPSNTVLYNPVTATVFINVTAIPGPAQLIVTRQLQRDTVAGEIVVTLTFGNTGGPTGSVTFTNLVLNTAKIGSVNPATPSLPTRVANSVVAGVPVSVTLRFPGSAGAPGNQSILSIGATYDQGTISSGSRITLP